MEKGAELMERHATTQLKLCPGPKKRAFLRETGIDNLTSEYLFDPSFCHHTAW
jgi:hypothetical protein